jgi:hypothetical protein
MTALMQKILEDKRRGRADLADRPFAEKVALLEKLRARRTLVAASGLRRDGTLERPASP